MHSKMAQKGLITMKTDNRQAVIHLAQDALAFADQINTDWLAEKQLTHLREQIALARK